MNYKGYSAKIEFDEDDNILRGEVIGLRDFIIFEGESADDIRKSFHAAVDDYLEFCRQRGEEPDKPFSGKFIVRVNPALHRQIISQAQVEGLSLNSWIAEHLQTAVDGSQPAAHPDIEITASPVHSVVETAKMPEDGLRLFNPHSTKTATNIKKVADG